MRGFRVEGFRVWGLGFRAFRGLGGLGYLHTYPKGPSTIIVATSWLFGPQKYILYWYLDPLGYKIKCVYLYSEVCACMHAWMCLYACV